MKTGSAQLPAAEALRDVEATLDAARERIGVAPLVE
jgi:hypothetical protein